MSNPIPSLLALTSIADGSPQQAAPIRNNYSAIQTAANEVIAALSGGASGQVLQAVDASHVQWGTRTTVSAITAGPPASPADGDIWIATGVDANGTRWQFQYNAGSASAYKWEFIGGAMLNVEVGTFESSTTVGAFFDLATVGPSYTVARGGDYMAQVGASVNSSVSQKVQMGPCIATNNVENDGTVTDTNFRVLLTRWIAVHGITAGVDIRTRYLANAAGTTTWGARTLSVLPVRIA